MPKKPYQDGQYYWVRRKPSTSGETANPTSHHPLWEPMMWGASEQAFFQAGARSVGHKVTSLAAIGGHIPRREPRRTKNAWVATTLDGRNRLVLIHDVIGTKTACRQMGTAPPVRIEVSWDVGEFLEVQAAQRLARREAK